MAQYELPECRGCVWHSMNYLSAEDVCGTVREELPGLRVPAVAVAATRGRAHLVPVASMLGHLNQGFRVL